MRSQINRDQKSNSLFLQLHDQPQRFWVRLVKNRSKTLQIGNIYYIGYITIK